MRVFLFPACLVSYDSEVYIIISNSLFTLAKVLFALWFKANTNACSQKRFSSCFFSCIFFMAPVSGWDIIVSNSTFCPHSWKWASPKLLLLWGVPSLQWSVSIKSGQKEGMGGDPATWSWGGKSHWCTWWAKIAHCGLIQLMSYWG